MISVIDGVIIGVLNDWDMAKLLGLPSDNLTAATHRTGSFPFLALDLLAKEQLLAHWYRHDLEAFFYLLLWASVHYNLKAKTRDIKTHACLVKWVGTKDDGRSLKQNILSLDNDGYEEIIRAVKVEFVPLIEDWIEQLRDFLTTARMGHQGSLKARKRATGSANDTTPEDAETWGGRFTFKKFLGAIALLKLQPKHELAKVQVHEELSKKRVRVANCAGVV